LSSDASGFVTPPGQHGSAAAAVPLPLPPAGPRPAVLYADALLSLFQFLELRELVAALCVSRAWCAVVRHKLPSAGFLLYQLRPAQLLAATHSSLARQIGRVVWGRISAADLALLSSPAWGGLRSLCCEFEAEQSPAALAFPPPLRELQLSFCKETPGGVLNALKAIGRLPHLETLYLSTQVCFASVAPLQDATRLRSLYVDEDAFGRSVPPRTMRERLLLSYRLLTQVRVLSVPQLTPVDVGTFLRSPHQLSHLEELGFVHELDDAAAALLPSLVALRLLTLSAPRVTTFAFVLETPQLRELQVHLQGMAPTTRAALPLSASSGHFARLSALILSAGELDSDELAALLAGMPQLCSLTLRHWQLPTLHFLGAAPQLASTLSDLELFDWPALPVSELSHVHGLTRLRTLVLSKSFTEPLSESAQQLYSPGCCPHFPQLARFEYTPRDEPGKGGEW